MVVFSILSLLNVDTDDVLDVEIKANIFRDLPESCSDHNSC